MPSSLIAPNSSSEVNLLILLVVVVLRWTLSLPVSSLSPPEPLLDLPVLLDGPRQFLLVTLNFLAPRVLNLLQATPERAHRRVYLGEHL